VYCPSLGPRVVHTGPVAYAFTALSTTGVRYSRDHIYHSANQHPYSAQGRAVLSIPVSEGGYSKRFESCRHSSVAYSKASPCLLTAVPLLLLTGLVLEQCQKVTGEVETYSE